MLKGLKKGKNTAVATASANQSIDCQDQIEEQSTLKVLKDTQLQNKRSTNQNNAKNNFVMQMQEENEQMITEQLQKQKANSLHSANHQNNFNILNNFSSQTLRRKAVEVMEIFSGTLVADNKKFNQAYMQYEQLERKSYASQRNSTNKGNKQDFFINNVNSMESPPKKGKFQYEFNYEEQDDEKHGNGRNFKKSESQKRRSRPVMKSQKIQDYCPYCPDNQQLKLISASNYVYLALPKRKTFKKYWHFILAPVEHQPSSIALNNDTITEITNYKKCLLQMFDQMKMHVVFFQQYSHQNSHIFIECLVVPLSKGQDFPFFFKQALQGVQGNWTTHKSIIKIEKQKGGLQKQIPKKIKYFYIDFSLGYGYAHVIENNQFWKKQFCQEVLATALGLQLYQVKTADEYTDQENRARQEQFAKIWGPFDWTKCISAAQN